MTQILSLATHDGWRGVNASLYGICSSTRWNEIEHEVSDLLMGWNRVVGFARRLARCLGNDERLRPATAGERQSLLMEVGRSLQIYLRKFLRIASLGISDHSSSCKIVCHRVDKYLC